MRAIKLEPLPLPRVSAFQLHSVLSSVVHGLTTGTDNAQSIRNDVRAIVRVFMSSAFFVGGEPVLVTGFIEESFNFFVACIIADYFRN